MKDILNAIIKAYEIQGVMALENSLGSYGIEQSWFTRFATTAVVTQLLGGDKSTVMDALSLTIQDAVPLKTIRSKEQNKASLSSAQVSSQSVRIAFMAVAGEKGLADALTNKMSGFYTLKLKKSEFEFRRSFTEYIVNNIIFRDGTPGDISWQSAIEAATRLHFELGDKLQDIDRIVLKTHMAAFTDYSTKGDIVRSLEREKAFKMLVAEAITTGRINIEAELEDKPEFPLYENIFVEEELRLTEAYQDTEKRALANSIRIFFKDGNALDKLEVVYPVGHKIKREEGTPLIKSKFERNIRTRFSKKHAEEVIGLFNEKELFESLAVNEFMDLLVV